MTYITLIFSTEANKADRVISPPQMIEVVDIILEKLPEKMCCFYSQIEQHEKD